MMGIKETKEDNLSKKYSSYCPEFSSEQIPTEFPTIAEEITLSSIECPEIHWNFSKCFLKSLRYRICPSNNHQFH